MFGLPSTTPKYQFEGVKQCSAILEKEMERWRHKKKGNPYVVISAVDERTFLECFIDPSEDLLKNSCMTYDPHRSLVLLRMETLYHAAASDAFIGALSTWSDQMNSILLQISRAAIKAPTRTKKADCAARPADLPAGREKLWPSLIVEVRYSEPRTQLQNDMLFWLGESNGEVKVALSITVSRNKDLIIYERWTLLPPQTRSKKSFVTAETLVRMSRPRPKDEPDNVQISGEFKIPFEEIYLRDKAGNETDFTLDHSKLKRMALKIWSV